MTQRIALVTGGGGGIGRAICRMLAEADYLVVASDIAVESVNETARLVTEAGGICEARTMDVTSTASVNDSVAALASQHGSIDVLVNCAGWDGFMPFLETDEAFWDKVIDLNFKGTLRTCHAILPGMMERGWGRVINIASDAGRVGSTLEAVYSGAKGGLIAFTKTIAREAVRYNITANSVCPGPTDTALLDGFREAGGGDKVVESIKRGIPMKRLGLPDDIAPAVVFLASDGASYITGQTLSVSGGLTMS